MGRQGKNWQSETSKVISRVIDVVPMPNLGDKFNLRYGFETKGFLWQPQSFSPETKSSARNLRTLLYSAFEAVKNVNKYSTYDNATGKIGKREVIQYRKKGWENLKKNFHNEDLKFELVLKSNRQIISINMIYKGRVIEWKDDIEKIVKEALSTI